MKFFIKKILIAILAVKLFAVAGVGVGTLILLKQNELPLNKNGIVFLKLLRKAKQGDPGAQYKLAGLYYSGKDIKRNYSKSVYWYKKAAEQGDGNAQFHLGARYYHGGEGVERNYSEAFYWFSKAAAQEYSGAQYFLGVFYDNGYGVDKDYSAAAYWYTKSAEHGDVHAQEELQRLRKEGFIK